MAAFDDPSRLASIPLFEGLGPADLEQLNLLLHRRTFKPGVRIINAQQPGEALYLLLEGSVKVQVDHEDGTEVTVALLGPGDTVGEMSLVEQAERSANVVALEETVLLWMDREAFLECLQSMSRLNYNLVRQVSARLRIANQKIQALARMDVAGRIARQLLHFAQQYGQEDAQGGIRIPLPLTQSDIAEMVGATRERVNHIMVAFRQEGAVSVDSHHRLTVHDREALEARCR
jgi:CRP/FNR family transcriptional regulator, cyclic AMP receptor protein